MESSGNTMTAIEIAKNLYAINFLTAQSDCPQENEKITYLLWQLEKMDTKQALRLMLEVIEVLSLDLDTNFKDPENPFRDMIDFRYISLDDYPTGDYNKRYPDK